MPAGFWPLLGLALRREQRRAAIWLIGLVLVTVATVESITDLYPTPTDLERYARTVRGNSALIVQAGPGYGLQDPEVLPTLGAVLMNELSLWVMLAVAIMSIFVVVRHTRAEEQAGRAELVRSLPVAPLTSLFVALSTQALVSAPIGAALAACLVAYGLPVAGSIAFGLSLWTVSLVFAAGAALTSQIAAGSRAALGLAGAAIGVSFAVRAIGDVSVGPLTWFSPLGWAQAIRAFAEERWWTLALPLVTSMALVAGAIWLSRHRDLGAGLVEERPGPATAGPGLSSPWGLAVRTQRSSVLWWSVGIGLAAFFYGIVADQAESIVDDNPEMADFFAQMGQGTITDAFLAAMVLFVALTATGFTISAVLRLRSEEVAGRAELVMAAGSSRRAWAMGAIAVAAGGTLVVLLGSGLAMGIGLSLVSGEASWVLRLTGASLAMVPAVWTMGAVAVLSIGLGPRWAPLAWGVFAAVVVIGLLGPVLDLPESVTGLSPFEHVPALPSEAMNWWPLSGLTAVAGLLVAVGLWALDRRDIG